MLAATLGAIDVLARDPCRLSTVCAVGLSHLVARMRGAASLLTPFLQPALSSAPLAGLHQVGLMLRLCVVRWPHTRIVDALRCLLQVAEVVEVQSVKVIGRVVAVVTVPDAPLSASPESLLVFAQAPLYVCKVSSAHPYTKYTGMGAVAE